MDLAAVTAPAAALLVLAALLPSCASPEAGPPAGPPGSLPPSSAAAPEPDGPSAPRRAPRRGTLVPDVVGLPLAQAVRRARRLEPAYRYVARGPCRARPTVLDQRPVPGRVRGRPSMSLEVTVGRCPLEADLRAVAAAYVALARGGPPPPTTDPVALLVGHEVVALLRAGEAADPDRWTVCPDGGSYAAFGCPFDLLGPFARGRVAVSAAPPSHPCLHATRLLPSGLVGLRSVTLTRRGSCVDHLAVRLFVDADGRVVAADLERPEP